MKQHDDDRRQATYLKLCALPPDTEDRTFETFKHSHSADLKEAYQSARDVISGKISFLTLVSKSDRGKTHLAIAICREWLKLGKTAKYVFVPLLLKDLKSGFGQEGVSSYDYKLDFYMKVGLLVLDDLGTENETAWVVQELETIIDYRYINSLPTVVTTNLSFTKLNEKYKSERITSRLERAKKSKLVLIGATKYTEVKKGEK